MLMTTQRITRKAMTMKRVATMMRKEIMRATMRATTRMTTMKSMRVTMRTKKVREVKRITTITIMRRTNQRMLSMNQPMITMRITTAGPLIMRRMCMTNTTKMEMARKKNMA